MSLVTRYNRLFEPLRKAVNAVRQGAVCTAIGSVVLVAFSAQAETSQNSYPDYSLSFRSYGAPAHMKSKGFGFHGVGQSSQNFSEDQYTDPTEPTGWRGYLQEKGPSRVIVEVEEQHEIKPLPEEVWNLILGKTQEEGEELVPESEMVRTSQELDTAPSEENDENPGIVESGRDHIRQYQMRGGDGEGYYDYEAEAYRQLMELFNRPVYATPSKELGDEDNMVSFRNPQESTSSDPYVREGSRARFEIRR